MQSSRGFGNAIVIALISVGLMVGALSISLVEFVPEEATPTLMLPSPAPLTATPTQPPTETPTVGLLPPTATVTSTFVNTSTPPPSCPPPPGWNQITIRIGDTIDTVAARYRVSKGELRSANCLTSDTLFVGTTLYVPPAATSTVAVCIPGAVGWRQSYVVKAGNTIFTIATNHYTTADLLKRVNCRSSDLILPGELLWVPNIATRTPYPTPLPGSTVTPYPTDPLTQTALPFTLTPQPSDTPIPPTPTTAPTFTDVPFTLTPSPTAFPNP